jgi:two-component system, LytTR family, response regulator LytT
LKILAVGNEPREVMHLERLCSAVLAHRLERFASAPSPREAAPLLRESAFDVVLLDHELREGDTLESLLGDSAHSFQTIVVSANLGMALHAFECGVLDFVPKPVGRERLARALHRVRRSHDPAHNPEPFLAVRRLGRIDLLAVDDLLYVEGADKYSELVLSSGQRSFYDKCLGRLEATLPRSFVRIHKSYLVRFNMVSRLHVLKGSRYFAELKNGLRLPVGRSRYEAIKSRLI